eukprot:gene8654-6081_t
MKRCVNCLLFSAPASRRQEGTAATVCSVRFWMQEDISGGLCCTVSCCVRQRTSNLALHILFSTRLSFFLSKRKREVNVPGMMLGRTIQLCARRKHGQRVWNPNTSPQGAAPSAGVSGSEAQSIAYRPLPPSQTVEYEEDFGSNLMIHREFISKKNRELTDFQLSSLAYSDIELTRGRQHLARIMNTERAGAAVGPGAAAADRVPLTVGSDGQGGNEPRSARYLFDEPRMQYCERFRRFFRSAAEKYSAAAQVGAEHPLFSLMEVCAILYGCETREAQETYLKMFLSLDTESLEEEQQQCTAPGSNLSPSPALEDAGQLQLPSIFDDVQSESPVSVPGTPSSAAAAPAEHTPPPADQNSSADAALRQAYEAHAAGRSPAGSYDLTHVAQSLHRLERMRWRRLIEKLVCEEYETLTPEDYGDALVLNNQLHTVKFLDLKVGDALNEMMSHLEKESGVVTHTDAPPNASPSHPDTRN